MPQRTKFRIIFALLFLFLTSGCGKDDSVDFDDVVVTLKLGFQPDGSELTGLVLLAEDQGMFKKNGLHITYKNYSSGGLVLDALEKKEVDLGFSGEYVVSKRILYNSGARIIASIARSETISIVAHKGIGIQIPSDLKGRKIALVSGSQLEFDLERFLLLQGLDVNSVKTRKMLTGKAVYDAFIAKKVEAVIIWEPYTLMIKESFGKQINIWPAQSEQPQFWLVIAHNQYIRQNPDEVHGFLNAIRQAELFMESYPDDARRVIFKNSGHRQDHFDHIASFIHWELEMSHSLLVAMENQARWLVENYKTNYNAVPNLLGYFYFDGIEQVKPNGCFIIH